MESAEESTMVRLPLSVAVAPQGAPKETPLRPARVTFSEQLPAMTTEPPLVSIGMTELMVV